MHLLSLLRPLTVGAEILPGVRLEDTSTELGLRLRFSVNEDLLWVDVGPLDRMRRHAARSEMLGFGYRTEGGRSRLDPGLGLRLCEALARVVRANEHAVLDEIRTRAAAEADPAERIRHVDVTRALDLSGLGGSVFYTLNPYVGCVIGCRFCYAQSPLASMRRMMGLADHEWGAYVEVRRNLADVLSRELETMDPLPIKFCPIVGDAYQGPEKRERVTRACLEAIVRSSRRWPALILTRSALILRDVEVLARLPEAWAGISLPTVDDEVRRHFEPRAASVAERIEVFRAMRAAGIRTVGVVQPIMAGSIEALADVLAAHVDAVIIDVLREEEDAAADFDDPRFRATRTDEWQRDRALELLSLLRARNIAVWAQELPPQYCAPDTVTLR